ncbi:MAG: pyridoxal-phosphate dependent enzyme, partial [Acidobacteria bacterium]|nr:pyridoxal-phosphate dependent enzyme [Acidobacteriota bacterium]
EPAGCAALHHSLEAGRAVSAPCETVCDGAAVPYLTEELYPALASLVDRTVLVPDAATLATSRDLLLGQKIVTEPSGALATAAARMVPVEERGLSVALLTGASVGAAGIRRLLD